MSAQEFFIRKASGMRREVSAWDAMIMCFLIPGIYWPFLYGEYTMAFYPGVNLVGATIVTFLMYLPLGLLYILLSASMPRSGGDYIWVSRGLNPALGFMLNFYYIIIILTWIGTFAAWETDWGLSPLLSAVGIATSNPGLNSFGQYLYSTPEIRLGIGIVSLLLMTFVLILGAKTCMRIQWASFAIGIFGLFVWAGVFLSVGPEGFARKFTELGMSPDAIIGAAKQAGYSTDFSLSTTVIGSTYTALNFIGFNWSAYIAGEIKGVTRSHTIAILGALILFTVFSAFVYAVLYAAWTPEFAASLSYLWVTGNPAYKLTGIVPLGSFIIGYVTDNAVIAAIPSIGFTVTIFAVMVGCAITATRCMFAWSFDRLLPTKIAAVDRRYASPYVTIILVFIAGIIFEVIWIYTTWFSALLYGMFGWYIATTLIGLAAMTIPYRRRDIMEVSPPLVQKKVAGMPLITILGFLTAITSAFLAYSSVWPSIYGPVKPVFIAVALGLFVPAPLIYYIAYAYYKGRGIPLSMLHKEIPPD